VLANYDNLKGAHEMTLQDLLLYALTPLFLASPYLAWRSWRGSLSAERYAKEAERELAELKQRYTN